MSIVSALLGHPVKHSVSNYLFNILANYAEIDDYHHLKIDTKPNEIKSKLNNLINIGCIGFNITMPYKISIVELITKMDSRATKSGAINCIKIKNKKMIGYNTDGIAAWQTISRNLKNPSKGESFLILGSGGTARSIIEKTLELGLKTCVLCRNNDEALYFKKKFSNQSVFFVKKLSYETLFEQLKKVDFLINTTPVGMIPDTNHSLISNELWINVKEKRDLKTLYVFDVILNPYKTKLLKDAERYGANIVSGLWMMIYQGIEAFKIWTEIDLLHSIDLELLFSEIKKFTVPILGEKPCAYSATLQNGSGMGRPSRACRVAPEESHL